MVTDGCLASTKYYYLGSILGLCYDIKELWTVNGEELSGTFAHRLCVALMGKIITMTSKAAALATYLGPDSI